MPALLWRVGVPDIPVPAPGRKVRVIFFLRAFQMPFPDVAALVPVFVQHVRQADGVRPQIAVRIARIAVCDHAVFIRIFPRKQNPPVGLHTGCCCMPG